MFRRFVAAEVAPSVRMVVCFCWLFLGKHGLCAVAVCCGAFCACRCVRWQKIRSRGARVVAFAGVGRPVARAVVIYGRGAGRGLRGVSVRTANRKLQRLGVEL